jgi:hypothetical protein
MKNRRLSHATPEGRHEKALDFVRNIVTNKKAMIVPDGRSILPG